MKTYKIPIRTTIVLGMLCAIFYYFVTKVFQGLIPWSIHNNLIAGTGLVIYGLMLAKWSFTPFSKLFFPFIVLFSNTFFAPGETFNYFILFILFSWIRSGICFELNILQTILVESTLCVGGVVLVTAFSPVNAIGLSLGICMFFIIQSVYFLFFPVFDEKEKSLPIDQFENAYAEAKKIVGS